MALVQVRVPDIGDFKDVAVIEVFVQPGDAVKVEQSLITVESDKASMEIPSSAAGVVRQLKVKLGDRLNQGDLLAILEGVDTVSPPPVVEEPAPAKAEGRVGAAQPLPTSATSAGIAVTPPVTEQKQATAQSTSASTATISVATDATPAHDPASPPLLALPHASPSVRKFARELGVPLAEVKGSGPKGRITQQDVQDFTRAVMAGSARTQAQAATASGGTAGGGLDLIAWPKVDFAKFGPIERQELARIKKISGPNLLRNAVMIPSVTNHDDADITGLEALRVQLNQENEHSGVKVTLLAFLIKASVAALKKFPDFNTSLDAESGNVALIRKHYWHIGFAADTPGGLVVPVIKDADQKGVLQISQEMAALAGRAREGKLGPADMSGATFTISSLGGIGGRYFTPIINAPEVAILGVCRSRIEPVWDGQAFQPRLLLPLSLTWDHRVIDGAAAARFNAYLCQILADLRRVLL